MLLDSIYFHQQCRKVEKRKHGKASTLQMVRLYQQIVMDIEKKMPDAASDSVESQIEALRKVASKRLILVVLDGTL